MINICIEGNAFPKRLKLLRVVTVYKKGNVSNKSIYRPIAITPIFHKKKSKLF